MSAEYELRIVKTINEKLTKQFDELKSLIDEQQEELDLVNSELSETVEEVRIWYFRKIYTVTLASSVHHRYSILTHEHQSSCDSLCSSQNSKLLKALEDSICPITREPIRNEVINVADATKYEKEAIEERLIRSNSSPVTRALTTTSDLQTVKSLCEGVQRLSTAEQSSRRLESDLEEEQCARNRSERHVAALRDTLIQRDER